MREKIKILTCFTQCYNGRRYVTVLIQQTTSGLSILLHVVLGLPDAASCDKSHYHIFKTHFAVITESLHMR